MGAVDCLNKNIIFVCIWFIHYQKRYQRQYFLLLSLMGYHDSKIIMEDIIGPENIEKLRREYWRFDYFIGSK